MSKACGMASWGWVGVSGHHCEVRQRASADEFDRVMEHDDAEWIDDDHREQSCWKFELQRDCVERDSICAGTDQNDLQRD